MLWRTNAVIILYIKKNYFKKLSSCILWVYMAHSFTKYHIFFYSKSLFSSGVQLLYGGGCRSGQRFCSGLEISLPKDFSPRWPHKRLTTILHFNTEFLSVMLWARAMRQTKIRHLLPGKWVGGGSEMWSYWWRVTVNVSRRGSYHAWMMLFFENNF